MTVLLLGATLALLHQARPTRAQQAAAVPLLGVLALRQVSEDSSSTAAILRLRQLRLPRVIRARGVVEPAHLRLPSRLVAAAAGARQWSCLCSSSSRCRRGSMASMRSQCRILAARRRLQVGYQAVCQRRVAQCQMRCPLALDLRLVLYLGLRMGNSSRSRSR